MEFIKLANAWSYQLSEWDNLQKEDIEEALSDINGLVIEDYTMAPESDIWRLFYNGCEFRLVNDLVYGCDIRTTDQDDLSTMEKLIKKLDI